MLTLNKTKAALQSCQCHYEKPKQIKHARVNAGGQRMSQLTFEGADLTQLFNRFNFAPVDSIQLFDSSLACLRWRRLISHCMAVTINWAVLSPCSLTCSIASTTSCGARVCNFCDFSFFVPVAITKSPDIKWSTEYQKKNEIKHLKWIPLCIYSGVHLEGVHLQDIAKPGSARTLTGPLTTKIVNVSRQL